MIICATVEPLVLRLQREREALRRKNLYDEQEGDWVSQSLPQKIRCQRKLLCF
jgi:hypothetical protein